MSYHIFVINADAMTASEGIDKLDCKSYRAGALNFSLRQNDAY